METTTTAPTWWDAFIQEVRRTGRIVESLDALGLGDRAHLPYAPTGSALRRQLDEACAAGQQLIDEKRAEVMITAYREGVTLKDAATKAGIRSMPHAYAVLENANRIDEYRGLKAEREQTRRTGYGLVAQQNDRRLGEILDDLPEGPVRHCLVKVRQINTACDVARNALAPSRGLVLRDEVLAIVSELVEEYRQME